MIESAIESNDETLRSTCKAKKTMAIPTYDQLMLPLLQFLADGSVRSLDQAVEYVSTLFTLTSDERIQRIPSGGQTYIKNRTGWARTHLKKAGLVGSPKHGYMAITERGREALAKNPPRIDPRFLKQYPEYLEFVSRPENDTTSPETQAAEPNERTPDEIIEASYQNIRSQLADELLDTIKSCSPGFFERLVIDLLVAMGYGGSAADAARATRLSNDEGIDGVIKEDKLGLDTIYVQAKRWQNPVHRPDVQAFAGALQGKRSRKGIFITTSSFSDGAVEFAATIESRIILIDGGQLARLMIDHGVGVATQKRYEIKKIDSDYFTET
jgi:restriction system protein